MKALIDADILRYEIGYAAETAWMHITGEEDTVPPFSLVEDMLWARVENIQEITGSSSFCLYLTEGRTFRYDLASTKAYKGARLGHKPWHYNNLTAYMKGVMDAKVATYLEADDLLTLDHLAHPTTTVICSRDKDLRQVPGYIYSWELGNQPRWGPVHISDPGWLDLGERNKLRGAGFAWFGAQVLMGDSTDNIPGLPGWGPKKTYEWLHPHVHEGSAYLLTAIHIAYQLERENWRDDLLEQGRLCWLIRKLNPDGTPVMWDLEMTC